tara:strand:+ start:314 stop:580 length:267 start_codon:yes stop_codon:yes gene_type:complete
MTVFVTAVSLFIHTESQTFVLNWDKTSSWGMNDEKMKITAMLDNGKMVHWTADDVIVWDTVKHAIHRDYTTVYMMKDNCDVKVEVNNE